MSNTRRNFIKQSAKAAAGTYVASIGFNIMIWFTNEK